MASTVGSRVACGKLAGTGALIKVPLEFTPRVVKILKLTGVEATLDWNHKMVPGGGLKVVTVPVAIASGGITPVEQSDLSDGADPSRGFTLGADTDINVNTEEVLYEAWE